MAGLDLFSIPHTTRAYSVTPEMIKYRDDNYNQQLKFIYPKKRYTCSNTILALSYFIQPFAHLYSENRQSEPNVKENLSTTFRLPEMPDNLKELAERLKFFTLNYWNYYPFSDSVFVVNDKIEQIFVDYADILLCFYDPECKKCKEMENNLATFTLLIKLVQNGWIKVLALYTGKNIQICQNHQNEMPSDWIIAQNLDNQILNQYLYNLDSFTYSVQTKLSF